MVPRLRQQPVTAGSAPSAHRAGSHSPAPPSHRRARNERGPAPPPRSDRWRAIRSAGANGPQRLPTTLTSSTTKPLLSNAVIGRANVLLSTITPPGRTMPRAVENPDSAPVASTTVSNASAHRASIVSPRQQSRSQCAHCDNNRRFASWRPNTVKWQPVARNDLSDQKPQPTVAHDGH